MNGSADTKGFTVVELTALIFIGVLVLGIAIPKFVMASHMRKTRRLAVVLNRLFEAQYTYHHKHGVFSADISDLPIKKRDLRSKWFSYRVTYATRDTFFVRADVKRPFGIAATSDWAAISSAKIRSISTPETFGKYAVEWMMLMKRDEKRRKRERRKREKEMQKSSRRCPYPPAGMPWALHHESVSRDPHRERHEAARRI
jgi:Tfp pilus assembly protein PilE